MRTGQAPVIKGENTTLSASVLLGLVTRICGTYPVDFKTNEDVRAAATRTSTTLSEEEALSRCLVTLVQTSFPSYIQPHGRAPAADRHLFYLLVFHEPFVSVLFCLLCCFLRGVPSRVVYCRVFIVFECGGKRLFVSLCISPHTYGRLSLSVLQARPSLCSPYLEP